MKTIPLTQDQVALVDNEDYNWLNQWKWYAHKPQPQFIYYALRRRGKEMVRMHRQILGLKFGDGIKSDHKDGDGLNNQRYNLRKCTTSQNGGNRRKQRIITSSKYKGVHWQKGKIYKGKQHKGKWVAQIYCKSKYIYLGRFNSKVKAAKIYDQKAKELFGEFAHLNFKE